jgi:hypothetical protein
MEIEADQAFQGEITISHLAVGTVYFAVKRQNKRHGVFCDSLRRIGGDADNRNTEFLGGRQIDVIVTRATKCDQSYSFFLKDLCPSRAGSGASTGSAKRFRELFSGRRVF